MLPGSASDSVCLGRVSKHGDSRWSGQLSPSLSWRRFPLLTQGLSCGSEGRFMVLSCHNPDEVRNPHRFQPAYDESTQQCSPRYGESEYTGNRQFVTPACDPLTVRNYRKKHTEYTQGLQRAIRVLEMKGQV
ncbi:hypothetical protein RRG08_029345 [Elysia crispata]|uniref:Uncharacterized protein n=1 Tax=Elysia crispata TaxID=231223 RepID=A0AAE1ARY3_9GAST|nr:hypothetical protein RRG08_029345 [Elysia crispata]